MSKRSEAVNRWRRRTKQKMVEAMGGKCIACGYDKCPEAMDFHHLDPNEKEFSFGKIMANPKAISKLIVELRKCVLLCARCHREVHAGVLKVSGPCQLDESKLISENEIKRNLKPVSEPKPVVDRRKITLTHEQLLNILSEYEGNKSAVARELGVSETAVRKKLRSLVQPLGDESNW